MTNDDQEPLSLQPVMDGLEAVIRRARAGELDHLSADRRRRMIGGLEAIHALLEAMFHRGGRGSKADKDVAYFMFDWSERG